METNLWVMVGFGVLVVVMLAWLIVRKPPSSADEAQLMLAQAAEMARTLVMAAEQLHQTGRLPADGRFAWVKAQLEQSFNVDAEQAVALIEAGVYWAKQIAARRDTTHQPVGAQGLPVRKQVAH